MCSLASKGPGPGNCIPGVTMECADIRCYIGSVRNLYLSPIKPKLLGMVALMTYFLFQVPCHSFPRLSLCLPLVPLGRKYTVVEQAWVSESDLFQAAQLCVGNSASLSPVGLTFKW